MIIINYTITISSILVQSVLLISCTLSMALFECESNKMTEDNDIQWNLWLKESLGPTILSLACTEVVLFSEVEMHCIYMYTFGDIRSDPCREVVPFSEALRYMYSGTPL